MQITIRPGLISLTPTGRKGARLDLYRIVYAGWNFGEVEIDGDFIDRAFVHEDARQEIERQIADMSGHEKLRFLVASGCLEAT